MAVAGLAAASAGCGGGGVDRPEGTLDWTSCGEGIECTVFKVPIDEAHPDLGTFSLPAARAAARTDRLGVLFVNPGGPGGSGVELAKAAPKFFPMEVVDRFDIIGFDPRGAAGSKPGVECVDSLDAYVALDLSPDTDAEKQALLDVNRALDEGCEKRSGDILPFIGTERVARDMDRLRDALGEEKISYLGYSYGTFLGALYADAFPDRVRVMVLDGAIDPAKTGTEAILGQAFGFEDQLDAFLDAQEKDPSSPFFEHGGAGAAFDALMAEIDAHPIPDHPKKGPARSLGPGEAWWGVTEALYDSRNWPFLAQALADAQNEDATRLLELTDQASGRAADGSYDNSFVAFLAISNVDVAWPTTIAEYDALADQVRPKAPRLGVGLVYSSVSPIFWPIPAQRKAAPIAADQAPPIVVVGTTGDPATPYADAQALAKELATGVLLTWDGDGHTAFGGKSKCIDDAVSAYLIDEKVPATGKTCD
jgi:pimeloyl-ACP methyl ester carboxylesterase